MNELIPYEDRHPAIDRFRSDIDRLFDRLWRRWSRWGFGEPDFNPLSLAADRPALNLEETEDEVQVTAELPGLDPKDFAVELMNGKLVIRGEKQSTREEKGRDSIYSERTFGAFNRSVLLPCEVDEKKVEAQYKNGVLNIRLPKTEAAKAKRIKVKVA